jgi:hypothetical protein
MIYVYISHIFSQYYWGGSDLNYMSRFKLLFFGLQVLMEQ